MYNDLHSFTENWWMQKKHSRAPSSRRRYSVEFVNELSESFFVSL